MYKVHGVGINLNEYGNIPISGIRKEIGLRNNDFVCISAGDLVARKNYDTAIEAIAKCNNKRVHYLICGVGPENEKLQSLAKKMNVFNRIHFLGFRSDIKELMRDSDLFLFTTLQEGLPRSMMEAMACGLPCIASNIRGNVDLLDDKMGGYLCDCNDASYIAEKINVLADDEALRKSMSEHNLETIKKFDVSVVKEEIRNIYKEVLN